MPTYSRKNALGTLRDLRREAENRAKRALAAALAAHRRAVADEDRLGARLAAKQSTVAQARVKASSTDRAADAQANRRYLARLVAEAQAAAQALATHRAETLATAARAMETARAAHRKADQDHQVVDKAITRREATQRHETDRRAEAAMDDLLRKTPR